MHELWEKWVQGRSFNVTLHLFEASLVPKDDEKELRRSEALDYYVVAHVSTQRDRDATKQKTAPQRSLHPVWNQNLEFRSVGVEDCVRLEVKRNKLGSNELVCRTADLSFKVLLAHLGAADVAARTTAVLPADSGSNSSGGGGGGGGGAAVGPASVVPLELVGDKCMGTLLVGLSSDPSVPAFLVDSSAGSSSSLPTPPSSVEANGGSPLEIVEPAVVVHGNFACAVLP